MPYSMQAYGVFDADDKLVWREPRFGIPPHPAVFRGQGKKQARAYASHFLNYTVQPVRVVKAQERKTRSYYRRKT